MKKSIDMQKSARRIACISFAVFWFFIFFGTSLPFRETVTDVNNKATSNIVNQVVFSSLFLFSCFSLFINRQATLSFFMKEKFLFLFLLWCLLSTVWSDFSVTTFKRVFQLTTSVTVCLAALLATGNSIATMKYFKGILLGYVILTVIAIATVSGAIDPQTATWRGLATSKNHLGQVCLVAVMIWFCSFRAGRLKEKLLALAMIAVWLVVLGGSMAATSMIALALILAMGTLVFINNRILPQPVAACFSVLLIAVLMLFSTYLFTVHPDFLRKTLQIFGKDPTFTGRTELWSHVWSITRTHMATGCGYGGFWTPANPDVLVLYKDFVWLPNQAHMGYLDILNETGLIGILLLCGMIILYMKNSAKLFTAHYWHWFLVAALIINFQETTLFRANFLTGTMFLFAYIALYTDLLWQEKFLYQPETSGEPGERRIPTHPEGWSKEER